MIEIDGLTRRFGEVTAVDGLTLTIGEGEVFGLLGPNGAASASPPASWRQWTARWRSQPGHIPARRDPHPMGLSGGRSR